MIKPEKRIQVIRILVLILVIGITVALLLLRDRISEFAAYGYPGIFLISLLGSATVLVPLPGVIVTSAMGVIFNPFWVAIAAGLGAGLGELSGYLAGFSGQGVVEKTKWSDRLVGWMRKYGDIVILVLAIIPNPLFDIAGITSGALKVPVQRFLFWCIIGKIIKMLAFAYGGATVLRWFGL